MKIHAASSLLVLATLSALALLSPSCTDSDEQAPCSFDSDCIQGREICDLASSKCIPFGPMGCAKDADCKAGERCNAVSGQCRPVTTDMGGQDMTQPDMSDMSSTADMADMDPVDDMSGDDMPPGDTAPPQLVTITPAPNTFLDEARPTWTVQYNEPLDPLSVSTFTVKLRDAANQDVPVQVTPAGRSFTVTPSVDLGPGNAYVLVLDRLISDLAGNRQGQSINARYFTRFVEDPAHRALAERWAPIVYQDITSTNGLDWRADLPVAIDFDGDLVSENNRDRAFEPAYDAPAHVYYQVISSKTQHFIYYVLYYPVRQDYNVNTGNIESYEHDFAGVLMVVDRATDQLLAAEGAHVQDTDDRIVTYTRQGGPMDFQANGIEGRFNANTLEEGRRYPLYIVAGRHEACYWHDDQPMPPAITCQHETARFVGGDMSGVVLRPGVAQRWAEATTTNGKRSMTYGLLPLQSLFWTRRTDTTLFDRTFVYTPTGMRPAAPASGSGLLLPNRLKSDDARSFGKTPFRWLPSLGLGNYGQWLIDPAYTLRQRYAIQQSTQWSLDYCDNFFLEVAPASVQGCATP
jgi:hypothetical protein